MMEGTRSRLSNVRSRPSRVELPHDDRGRNRSRANAAGHGEGGARPKREQSAQPGRGNEL
jgi:hypothetical protein